MNVKRFFMAALFVAALGLSQTATASSPVTKSKTNTVTVTSAGQSQISVSFCEKLLEKWCRAYYKECFHLRYKENSLSMVEITKINESETVINLKGLHSYKGALGANYNDIEFRAVIYYKGDNTYEIWFERWAAFREVWESATRTIRL